ncbi:MAG: SGNH/GDSL hydrolase family protein [Oscillospiraceae bacterium]|nr:SGNH/GDSL hydrolase family protein [Oscillospiraceae bacterium]
MKKLSVLFLCAAMVLGCTACAQPAASEPAEEAVTEPVIEKQPTVFDKYASNTSISTGSHLTVDAEEAITYRSYYPLQEYGELEYKFYFSNTLDSTWDKGRWGHAGMPCGNYEILSAAVYDGGTSSEDTAKLLAKVTFDGGNAGKKVTSGETFWSDAVTISVPEGHYLVWEWTVQGEDIPCIRMSNLAYSFFSKDGTNFIYSNEAPAPQLIGAKRDTKLKIAAFGDSITQGCESTEFGNDFWVTEVAETLGEDYSVWNLGIGYSRASDAALCGDWLERAKSADIVTVAFGTNDAVVGQYGAYRPSTADEIDGWLRTIVTELKDAGCQVILFNAPPFDFEGDTEATRTALNDKLPAAAEELGVPLFDWAAFLEDTASPNKAIYGGHPDGEGCALIAEKFLAEYGDMIGYTGE